jgi:hypothetical protein
LIAVLGVISSAYGRVPCSVEQGIFSMEQGIPGADQGFFASFWTCGHIRPYAQQIRAKPMAGLDADVLERVSTYLKQAASELEAMRSEC